MSPTPFISSGEDDEILFGPEVPQPLESKEGYSKDERSMPGETVKSGQ